MQHDSTYKAAFAHRRMVGDFLRLVIALAPDPHGVLGAIRLDTLERLPAEYVGDNLRQRFGDMVWRVQLQPRGDEPDPQWLHLLIVLEFQSETDWMMAARVLNYATHLYLDLDRRRPRGERFGERHPPPPLLPIVLYNGDAEWDAPVRYVDLRRPRGERVLSGGETPRTGVLCPELRYMGEAFMLIDIRALDGEALPEGNAAVVLSLIEQVAGPVDVEEALVRLFETLAHREDRTLEAVLLGWLRALVGRAGAMEREEFEEMVHKASAGRLRGRPEDRLRAWFVEARAGAIAEGKAEGKAEGRAEGESLGLKRGETLALARDRVLLRRQATLKFDAGTGDRLATLLEEVTDPERLAEVGEWIIRCEDGGALLERTEASLSGPTSQSLRSGTGTGGDGF